MSNPNLGWLGISRKVADVNLDEEERPTGEDHAAHATGRTCKRCGHVIEADQAARLRGDDDWVHDMCPS